MRPLPRFLRAFLTALLVPVLLFEEWGWAPLAAMVGRLARLPLWARLEAWVRSLPPWGALLAFFVPVLLLLPVKVLALFLFSEGHPAAGLTVLIVAKLAGTAIVARIFQLVENTLMRIPLFARWYPRWKTWKNSVLNAVRESAPWRSVRAFRHRVRRGWRRLWRA
ncbi:MAG: hypothetical protein EOO24_61275 [Comamonadaceae bacterium]|nr:MAG: hypothetical protein EOO24_61275 [Comamonadaceae bacterium]